ncbi:Uncharacterized protein Fot_42418 [Forsythia ovata]|uniref:Uncharacterized protein n=1 Tax=Forsythia ovata TaxID=205694 RepID=A0ABD1RL39_9LAMI
MLPIFAETRDSSDEGPVELGSSSIMDISGYHSGERRKGSARRSKGKAEKNKKCRPFVFSGASCKCGRSISCQSSKLSRRGPELSPVNCMLTKISIGLKPQGNLNILLALVGIDGSGLGLGLIMARKWKTA